MSTSLAKGFRKKSRFDFSTSLTAFVAEDIFSPQEKDASPVGRSDVPPKNTNRKKTNRKKTKINHNPPTGGVADGAAPPHRAEVPSASNSTRPAQSNETTSAKEGHVDAQTCPDIPGLQPVESNKEALKVAWEENEELDHDEDAMYMVSPEEYGPVLKVYRAVYVEVFGREPQITQKQKQAIYNSRPGSGYLSEHFRGPLLDIEFMRALFVFCRTHIPDWKGHEWELHSNDLSPLVVLRDGPVNRLLGLVRAARGIRNWKYMKLLASLPPEGELARRIAALTRGRS